MGPHVHVTKYAPHELVMRYAAVVVTHAGHGTLTSALANGVPVVAMPNGFDQPVSSARVAELGAGLLLDGENATREEIKAAVDRCVGETEFRHSATRLKTAVMRVCAGTDPLSV